MEENKLVQQTETMFESIKHTGEFGIEYWLARELMLIY